RVSASAVRGTATSSTITPPLPVGNAAAAACSIAGYANRRAASSASASVGSVATYSSVAPALRHCSSITARSAAACGPVSAAASSSAAASVRSPIGRYASIAARWVRSTSSNRLGVQPAALIAATAAPAAAVVSNTATRVRELAAAGRSASVISVITPRVPSEPTNSRVRSYPATPLAVRRPVRSTEPSANTTSSPSTYSLVTPYLTQ